MLKEGLLAWEGGEVWSVESISNKSLFFMVLSCHVRDRLAHAEDGSQIDAGIMQETYMVDADMKERL